MISQLSFAYSSPHAGTRKRNTVCPTRYRTWHFFNSFTTNEDITTKFKRTTDTFLFISHTTKLLLVKFRYSIFNGVRNIKEMPGSVASGTHCIKPIGVRSNYHIGSIQQTRCDVSQFIYFCKSLYVFQTVFTPNIRSIKTAHTASGICRPLLLPAASLARLAAGRMPDAVCAVLCSW